MQATRRRWFLGLLSAASIGLALSTLAQAPARGKDASRGDKEPARTDKDAAVRLRKIEGFGTKGLVKTPNYRTNVSASTRTARDWAQITLTYDTEPEWIDELAMTYSVLLVKPGQGQQRDYLLLRSGVVYVDVAKGREHISAMYIRPTTLLRYGTVVATHVEVMVDGAVVAEASEIEGMPLPERWWETDKITVRDGLLLNRAQTPFANINIDDYETIRE